MIGFPLLLITFEDNFTTMKRFPLYFLTPLVYLIVSLSPLLAQSPSQSYQIDSMVTLLSGTSDEIARLDILINLSDLASGRKDVTYSKILWKEAMDLAERSSGEKKDHALYAASAASIKLIVYNLDNKSDSLDFYLEQARDNLKENDARRIPEYYKMIRMVRSLQGSDPENIKKTQDELMEELKGEKPENRYQELSKTYLVAVSAMLICEMGDSAYNANMRKTFLHYVDLYYNKAMEIPLDEDFLFRSQAYVLKCSTYKDDDPEMVTVTKLMLHDYDKTLEDPRITKRPYYSQRARIRCLAILSTNETITNKERKGYFNRFIELIDKYPAQSPSPPAVYYRANCSYSYYYLAGDYSKALENIDIVIETTPYSATMPMYLKDKIDIQLKLGDYKGAFNSQVQLAAVEDSVSKSKNSEKYYSLLDQFQVNEARLKHIESVKHYQSIIIWIALFFIVVVIVLLIIVLRLWKKSKESDLMKTSFIKSMCHEIRTPLNVISGYTQIIADENFDPEEKERMMQTIYFNNHILTGILDSMLHISNLSSGKEKLVLEKVDIVPIIGDEVSKVADKYNEKNIKYNVPSPSESFIVLTSKQYFCSILNNVVDNAFKFSNSGEVDVSYKYVKKGSKVEIIVTDQGIGIPLDKYDFVFEKFTKLDDFTQGVGLGLYLCRLVLNQLRGSIRIDNTYTSGTRVIITLPA